MRDGICPKCNATSVFGKRGGIGVDSYARVRTGMVTGTTDYMTLLCTKCGSFEDYIDDEEKLAEVEKTWHKVGK